MSASAAGAADGGLALAERVRPAVLVMARAPRRGEVRRALEPLIGPEGCVALQTALTAEALQWGRSVAPERLFVGHEPVDGGRELGRLAGAGATLFPQNGDGIAGRVADAVSRVWSRARGPVIIIWPELPRFTMAHAQAVLGDLEAGMDLVLGPVYEGGYYLLALARPLPELFELPEQAWRGPDSLPQLLQAAIAANLEVGLLRAERSLHRPTDVRAALADPQLPDLVARVLGRR